MVSLAIAMLVVLSWHLLFPQEKKLAQPIKVSEYGKKDIFVYWSHADQESVHRAGSLSGWSPGDMNSAKSFSVVAQLG
jgi:hypothetical protein